MRRGVDTRLVRSDSSTALAAYGIAEQLDGIKVGAAVAPDAGSPNPLVLHEQLLMVRR